MDAKRWFTLATEKIEEQNFHKAKDLLDNTIQFDDEFVEAYRERALVHIHQGNYTQAMEDYDRALELEDDITTRLQRAGLYLVLDKPKQARAEFEEIFEQEDNLDALKGIGDTYYQENNFKGALETYDKVLEKGGEDAFVWFSKAQTYYKAQNHEKALEAIERAIELEHQPEFFAFKGDFFIRHDNFERALEQYVLAANIDRDNEELQIRLGFIYRILERPKDAVSAFDKALRINPYNTEAMENKIDVLQSMGKPEAARAVKEQLVRLNPTEKKWVMDLAHEYMDNGGYEKASELFSALLKKQTTLEEAWYGQAYCQYQIGDYEEALIAIEEAIEQADDEVKEYKNLKEKIEEHF